MTDIRLRLAGAEDIPAIAGLIRDIDLYYRSPDVQTVEATEAKLRQHDFGGTAKFEILLAEIDEGQGWQAAGIATLATLYSTNASRPAFFIKDLFVRDAWRGHGLGRKLMRRIAALALERDYARIDWTAEAGSPDTLRFYDSIGAQRREEKIFFRLNGENLRTLAEE